MAHLERSAKEIMKLHTFERSCLSTLVLGCVLFAGCATKASLAPSTGPVSAPSFHASAPAAHTTAPVDLQYMFTVTPKIVATTAEERAEVASLLVFLETLEKGAHNFDLIVQIDFSSPMQATAQFEWSGGFHFGVFRLVKEAGVWTLRDEFHFL